MGRFLDLLTRKLYSFKNANGSDINIGLSDKLIVTPKALSESDVFCNTSIPLVLPSVFSTKSSLFVINPNVIVIPTNGNFYPNRSTRIKTQLFANVYVNAGLMGELCLVDLATNKIVAGSTISFKNISYTTIVQFHPEDYKTLFVIALAPGLLAVLSSFLLKDKNVPAKESVKKISFFSFLSYWKTSPTTYRKLVIGLLLFTLFNSSDIFLLLKAKQSGLDDASVIGVYIFYNLVYAIFAFPLGILADKIGLKRMFIFGLVIFAVVYFGMAHCENKTIFYGIFLLYGIYAAATEGISKAWISNISDKKDTATAIGAFSALQSICTMFASALAGVIWFQFGAMVTFTLSAFMTLLVVSYLLLIKIKDIK